MEHFVLDCQFLVDRCLSLASTLYRETAGMRPPQHTRTFALSIISSYDLKLSNDIT